jgi:hypothetical protein
MATRFDRSPSRLPPIDRDSEVAGAIAALQPLLDQVARIEKRLALVRAEKKLRRGSQSLLERAGLVRGSGNASPSANDEIEDAKEELEFLRVEINKQRAFIEQARTSASYAATLSFKDRINADLVRALEATRMLHRAYADIYAVMDEMREAGYTFAHGAVPTFQPEATFALGDPDAPYTGQASTLRTFLLDRGIISE